MAYSVQHNTPASGSIQWSGMSIQYLGEIYAIVNGHTNTRYAYWTPAYPNNLVVTNDFPALGDDDCLIFVNKSGTALTVPNSTVVSGDLIIPGSILADALAANSVTADKIMAGAVSATSLAANSVTAAAICADAIGAVHISADAVTADAIVTGAVTADAMAANSVLANSIAANAVTADKISANAVTAVKILAGAIEAGKIATDAITAGNITTGAITAGKIATDAIAAGNIQANAITSDKIIANAITTAKIASSAVTANEILANTITAAKISSDAIEARHIKAGQVETSHISAGVSGMMRIEAVSAVMVGARNLMKGTYIDIATSTYNLFTHYITENLVAGKVYTLSFRGTKPATQAFGVYQNGGVASPGNAILGSDGYWTLTFTAIAPTAGNEKYIALYQVPSATAGACTIKELKFETGNQRTGWSRAPEDPAVGVLSSHIDIATDHINIVSGGNIQINAGANFNLGAGAGKTGIGMSNNRVDNWFLWAGAADPASAPFRVSIAGKVYATNLQQIYGQSYWDMADGTYPAEFDVYIPSGFTVDSFTFWYKIKKARTFAKTSASSGGGTTGMQTALGTGGSSHVNTQAATGSTGAAGTGATGAAGVVATTAVSAGTSGGMSAAADTGSGGTGVTGDSGTGAGGASAPATNSVSAGAPGDKPSFGSEYNVSSSGGLITGASNSEFTSFSDGPGSHWHTMKHTHPIGRHWHDIATHGHGAPAGHAHTVNSHTHSMTAHTHSGPSHAHAMAGHTHIAPAAHSHNGGSHTHTGPSHSHDLNSHTHPMGHTHTITDHQHGMDNHSHGINYGINEKATAPTTSSFYVDGTLIGTYYTSEVGSFNLGAYMAAGWHTLKISPNDDARITGYSLTKLTAN